jgi:ABC-type polysaccharide/polyol phosphate transport system ATPase subunit
MARIELDRVGLTFRVRRNKRTSLKEYVLGALLRRSRNPIVEVRALRDVCLQGRQGDRIGVIGHNGAGKSTLLKLLAGVYPATEGRREVVGRISSLFDFSLGFEIDASGWDNIAFRCYLHGETPRSVRKKRQAIADFSELGPFLDMPVRYYSAGMLLRLAFSIATSIEPEVLLVDEVLSVGDLAFQTKARQRMQEMMARAHLMVLVSHDLGALAQTCNRAVWMDHGRAVRIGPSDEVIAAYQSAAKEKPHEQSAAVPAVPSANGLGRPPAGRSARQTVAHG